MNRNDIKLSTCKYQVSNLSLTIPGESAPYNVEPQYILGMALECLFDDYIFPYFELTICVPSGIDRAMRKANTDITASLRINYGFYENEVGGTGNKNNNIANTDWFSKIFYVYMDDCTPDVMEKYKEEYEKSTGTFKKGFTVDQMSFLKIILYNKDYLMRSKKIVNNVLSNVNVTDALAYVLNTAGITNVLMSPATNNKKYPQFILTPVTAMEQLTRIANEYGIHSEGSIVFFDLTRMYILAQSAKCSAYAPNEIKTTYFMSYQEMDNNVAAFGCYNNTSEKYSVVSITANSLKISTDSLLTDQIYGSSFLSVDANSGSVSTMVANTKKASGTMDYTGVIVKRTGDDTSSALKSNLEESNTVITCNVQGVCLNMLTPNREFIFSFDSSRFKQYAGSYRLTSMVCNFIKEGNLYVPNVNCKLLGTK